MGVKIGLVAGSEDFDACAFRVGADGEIPVILARPDMPGDRQRFCLAHELGHRLLRAKGDVDPEKMAHRFAAALLVPAVVARVSWASRGRRLASTSSAFHAGR